MGGSLSGLPVGVPIDGRVRCAYDGSMSKTKPTEKHADSVLIEQLGGTGVVARMVGVKSPSVSEWRWFGIPRARRQYLAVIRPDVFFAKPVIKKAA